MSLKILFADDSMTAQSMGKKILTEAGYEVVAVSNGAAAVKKIAEQKPDIIILDVYMPGYSGLEVCEKVRSSIATLKTPVLLTVGKMEPYKPEDANRVRADGVIIKPFEASDLLAIVKKFEERIAAMPAAVAPPPPPARPPVEEIFVPPAESNHEPPPTRSIQPMVEVPDHMATSSAFSELLGTDASHMESFHVPVAESTAVADAKATAVATPDYDLPAAWRPEPEPQPNIVDTGSVETPTVEEPRAEAEPVVAEPVSVVAEVQPAEESESALPRPIQIPVYQDAEPPRYEVIPTAAAPADVEVSREPGLQESAEETTRNTVADVRDPHLVPMAHHIPSPEQISVQHAAEEMQGTPVEADNGVIPQIVASAEHQPEAIPEPTHAGAGSMSEADFEARVAAAMASYGHAAEAGSTVASEKAETETQGTGVARVQPATLHEPSEAPAYEYHPAVVPAEEMHEQVFATVPLSVSAEEHTANETLAQAASAAANHDPIAAIVEAELPAAVHAVAQASGGQAEEHDSIAQAVHRVMERMKANLVEEIVRELKSKK